MSIRKKILIGLGSLLLIAVIGFGWMLWVIDGAFQLVEWQNPQGTLCMMRQPAKPNTHLEVRPGYVRGTVGTWVKTDPGATERWFGAPAIATPAELFQQARIAVNDRSDLNGLIAFYDDATLTQQGDIVANLEYLAETKDGLMKLKDAFEQNPFSWLAEIIQKAATKIE